jgi:nicotinamidase/pyrazinamidase
VANSNSRDDSEQVIETVKTVFFDVDTQLDFLYPAGALYVPDAETIVPRLGELTRYAASHGIPIVSTADAHSEDDPEFQTWPPHCVLDTNGQQKTAMTQLPRAQTVTTDANDSSFQRVPQYVVEKQKLDCFTNPNLRPLLSFLGADRYVLYGVATELCVSCAAMGLLAMDAQVQLVTDAIRGLDATKEREMLERFVAAGGTVTATDRVIGASARYAHS